MVVQVNQDACERSTLSVAIIGMVPGNGHPYSWSAIVNGYDTQAMAACPYPVIPAYLSAQPPDSMGIPGIRITHIWTDDPLDARLVAAATHIPNVVARPTDVIGEVDAVLIATDDGWNHVQRARPFVEAGLPVFVDKPLATTPAELRQFLAWYDEGARILSSSGLRYAPELEDLRHQEWLWISSTTIKDWDRYGIHALEPIAALLGPGFARVSAIRTATGLIATSEHDSGATATVACVSGGVGSFATMHAYGADTHRSVQLSDTFGAFREQLVQIARWLSGSDPVHAFEETVELMGFLMAARQSAELGGRMIEIDIELRGKRRQGRGK